MKRLTLSIVAVLCFSLVVSEAHASSREQWTSVRSENFTLVGNASEREIRDVAIKLEQYRNILARLFNGAQISHPVSTTVIVFKNDEAFKSFRPLYQGRPTEVAGYFQPGRDLNYMAISAERKGDGAFGTIFHELVHLFIDNNLRGLPLCFNEGLAEYYGSVKISDGGRKITLGNASAGRARLLGESKLLPLQTLLETDYSSDYYNEGDQRSLFYAQSWALIHFLLQRDEGNGFERFAQVLKRLSEGKTIDDGLREVFHSSVAEIENALTSYVRHTPFSNREVTLGELPAIATKLRGSEITDAEAHAYLGDLLLHLNRLDETEVQLQESLALNPNLLSAEASLGMLRVRQQRIEEAVRILRAAAAVDRQNYLTQYYFAYALSRESMGEDVGPLSYQTASVAEMRQALNLAVELSPNFIEAYRLHAFIDLAYNEHLDKAEELLKHALELSADRQDLMLILAQVHMRVLNFAAARKDLEPILQRAEDLKLREQAVSLLEDITYGEAQASRPDFLVRKNEEPASEQTALTGSTLQQQAHAMKPRLAKRFKGERVRGFLTEINCLDKGIALSVKIGDRTLRLHAAELRSVFFVTYVTGLEHTVTCGVRAAQNLVVLTYRPSSDPRATFDGEAIAIEFVPDDIDFEP